MTIQPTRIASANFGGAVRNALTQFDQGRQQLQDQNRNNALKANLAAAISGDRNALNELIAKGAPEIGLKVGNALRQQANIDRSFDFQQDRAQVSDKRDARNFDFRTAQAEEDKRRFGVTTGLRREQLAASRAAASEKPATKIGKLRRDFKKGLITQQDLDQGIAAISAPGLKLGPDGRLISVGQQNTKGVNTELQKQIAGDRVILRDLASIRQKFRPDFLTFAGRTDAALSAFNEKAEGIPGKKALESVPVVGNLLKNSPEERQFLKDRTKFNNEVEQTFNSYRKLITGAAAAVAELDRLQRTFLSGEMSPSQFEAALSTLEEKTARAVQVRQDLVNQGVSLSSDEAKRAIDEAVVGSSAGGVTSSGIKFTVE